ncbi:MULTISPECIES: hypothetical protein [Proteus]|jgi:hypothetical protein|uniref:Uncharacterized protein n=2 Tax=Proteus vulgaris TaxID=585 RepID=A0A379F403_PROVU|nr:MULTISPECIES: hypothetical protein [Proteus]NBN61042.1 hypothetical protein [Proteus sp. G2639]RNT29290.1 hypothetical protein B9475_008600 [Proteus mirabilis]AYY80459.1 hypothetical protein EGX81_06055 [Proteus vulgaris]KGA60573.1 hypothetical protein DR95_1002 [Proteus vulgaris]MBG5971586.1 hypothetical protein [Proteus vulgaris]
MLQVSTYLKIKDNFININEYNGLLKDSFYIEGAIELSIYNTKVIDIGMWDYVDQLWSYLIEGLVKINENKEFKANFPDQPIEIKFQPINDNVLITITANEPQKAFIKKELFIKTMALHAQDFFNKLVTFKGIVLNDYAIDFQNIKNLLKNGNY